MMNDNNDDAAAAADDDGDGMHLSFFCLIIIFHF